MKLINFFLLLLTATLFAAEIPGNIQTIPTSFTKTWGDGEADPGKSPYGGSPIRDVKLTWTNNTVVLTWGPQVGIHQIYVLKWHHANNLPRAYLFDGWMKLPPHATNYVDAPVNASEQLNYGVRAKGPSGISYHMDVFFNQPEDERISVPILSPLPSNPVREMLASNVRITNAAVSSPSSKR